MSINAKEYAYHMGEIVNDLDDFEPPHDIGQRLAEIMLPDMRRLEEQRDDLLAACKAVLANPWLAGCIEAARHPDLLADEVPDYAADCQALAAVADAVEAAVKKAEGTT